MKYLTALLGLAAAAFFVYQKRGLPMTISAQRPHKTSDAGKRFIIAREGLETKAYKDTAGRWAIGVGHDMGISASPAMSTITEQKALQLFDNDLKRFEQAVNNAIAPMIPLAQHEYDAMVSFAFNIGTGAFATSTLVKKFNQGDKDGAANEFERWIYITRNGEKVVDFGLTNRRGFEKALFKSGQYGV